MPIRIFCASFYSFTLGQRMDIEEHIPLFWLASVECWQLAFFFPWDLIRGPGMEDISV